MTRKTKNSNGAEPSHDPSAFSLDLRGDRDIVDPINVVRSLDKMIKEGERIFVRNTTDELEDGILGNVVITFLESPSGKAFPITIPDVKFPIDLSSQVPVESMRTSQDLRKLLEAGLIGLIPEKEALAEIADEEVADEIRDFLRDRRVRRKKAKSGEYSPDLNKEFDKFNVENENVNARVIAVSEEVKRGEVTAKTALRRLRAIASTFTEEDIGYMLSQIPDATIRQWVEGIAQKRK